MKKRLLSVLLVLAMLLSFAPAAGAATVTSGKCGDYVRWSYTESTGTLRIYGNGDTYDYETDWGVTAPWAEFQDEITTVVVESGVNRLGRGLLGGDTEWNYYPKLTSVTLPVSLLSIGEYAFGGANLTSITLPSNVTTIEAGAFYGVPLTSITLPSKLKTLGAYAFEGHAAQSVEIPASVEEIGEAPFGRMPPYVTVDAGNAYFSSEKGVLFDKEKTAILSYPSRSSQKIYTIPDTVQTADLEVFSYAEALQGLVIPAETELTDLYSPGEGYIDLSKHFSLYYLGDAPQNLDEIEDLGMDMLCFDVYFIKGTQGWEDYLERDYWDDVFEGYTKRFFHWDPASASFYQAPSGQYQIRVVDGNGLVLQGVQVTYDTQTGVTNAQGVVSFSAGTWGTPVIRAELAGYIPWDNVNSNWEKSETRNETIVLYPEELTGYKLKECRYSNLANLSLSVDLLTHTKTLNLKNTGNLIGDLDFGKFYLTCQAAEPEGVDWYELRQGKRVIRQCGDGDFGTLSVEQFSKGGGVVVRVITKDGQTVDTPINLQFVENKVNTEMSLKVMDKLSIDIDDDVPYFGGTRLELDVDAIPGDIVLTEDGFRIGFNCDINKPPEEDKDTFEKLKETIDAAKRAGGVELGWQCKAAFAELMKEETDFALPGGKFKATLIGYAEADWGSSEAKGELYLLIDAKTKTFGFNTVAVVVPVTVQVKAFAKVQAGGEISYNWSTNQADGGVKLDVTVGLNAFTGAGVGIVAGAGVYGQADVNVAGQLLGTKQGFEKVDLTGELGIKAYFAGLTYERPFAYNTWHLYSRNTVNAASLSRSAARIDWYDASQYEAEPLDYLDEESAWQGEAVSLLSADANTNLTALLENTYRNAQPVLLQTADALYAAFLRGNAETGQVAVCVTRFDGAGWEEPVQADADAILDDAPALCAAADGTVWLAYARSTADPQEDLLTYAENQSIVVGRIDPETLEFTESTTYPGQSYARLQQLTAVNGQPVLIWADSEVSDADSVLFSPRSRICTAEWSGDAWSEAREIAQVDKPVLALAAGELDGALAAAYLQDRDGASDTTADHDLYQLTDGEAICIQENVLGKLSFGAIPGQDSAGFLWNDADALCSNLGSVSVPGITSEYAVTGDSIYYSSATGANANLFVVKYQDEQWSAPIQLTKDGTRYLENLSAVRWNERDFVLGMHTYAAIYDSVMTYKNLVWAVVQPVSDLRLESVDYDVGSACAGESVPVTLSVYNAGDHAVTQIDILCDGTKQQTASCTLQPGAYGEFEISLTCPESCTEYTFRVEETGKSDDDFTPDDNIGTVRLGYADVSIALTEERVGTSRSAVAILTNQGVETASGTLIFADADGNHIGFIPFEELPSGDAAVSILPLADGFSGTVTVSALLDQPEWYTYNNTALLSVVRMTEPTTIRSAQISGGQVIVQFASTEDASCTAYCALYDAYGKLLKLTEASISPGEQEIRFDTAGAFDTAKIFLLDAAFTPLCEALTLKAT